MKKKYVDSIKKYYDNETYLDFLISSAHFIKDQIGEFKAEFLVTLGSGLSSLVESMDIVAEVPYASIPDFPVATNKSHAGKFVFGSIKGKNLICMNGRLHAYEGYKMYDVVAPLRIAKLLGVEKAIITNAVGAINKDYKIGDFVVLKDAITAFVDSPLTGPNIDLLGERFFDLANIYDPEYQKIALKIAKENDIPVHSGVQVQSKGPNYETAADIKMYRIVGADTVGMSNVCEAIAARHLKIRVLGLNFISNLACGISKVELSDDDVNMASLAHSKKFVKFVNAILKVI